MVKWRWVGRMTKQMGIRQKNINSKTREREQGSPRERMVPRVQAKRQVALEAGARSSKTKANRKSSYLNYSNT